MSTLSVNHLLGIKYLNKNDLNIIFETRFNKNFTSKKNEIIFKKRQHYKSKKSFGNINFCFWFVFNNKRLFTKKNTHIPKPNRGNRYVKKNRI